MVFGRLLGRDDCVEETKVHVNAFGNEGDLAWSGAK